MLKGWLLEKVRGRALTSGAREVEKFVNSLEGLGDQDMGVIVAVATAIRINLEIHGEIPEGPMLALVILALFRPSVVMDWFYPAFAPLDMDKFAAGEATAPRGYTVRFHLTRSTEYGDRFKLYRVPTPDMAVSDPFDRYGVKIGRTEGGGYEIADLAFGGLAEQAGMKLYDTVTEIDVETVGQPSKYLVYPFGIALLGLIIALQWPRYQRWKREDELADDGAAG